MDHDKNILLQKYPFISSIIGFLTLVLVFYFVLEWNSVTNSYWGFAYLLIAMPGMILHLIKIFRKH